MKNFLIVALLAMANAALAGQKVWLDAGGGYFDPANSFHRPVSYFELPLAPEGDFYRIKTYYANGQPLLEGLTPEPEWQTRQLIGDFREWHPNGQLKSSGHYALRDEVCGCGNQYPVKHGTFTSYHPNGQLAYIHEYHNDSLKDGNYEEFDADGLVLRQYGIVNFKYEGPYREYSQGRLVVEKHFRNGQMDGPHTTYNEQGTKLYEHFYKEGYPFGPQRDFYSNGQLQRAYVASKHYGMLEGTDIYYRPDGSVELRIYRVLNEQGEEIEYSEEQFYDNGQLANQEYRRGYHLISQRFDESGELIGRYEQDIYGLQGLYIERTWGGLVHEHYRDNLRHGPYLVRAEDGSGTQGQYEQGLKVGTWVETLADGSKSVRQYRAGELHGLQEDFDEHGNRIHFATYINGQPHGAVDQHTYQGREIATYDHGKLQGEYRLLTFDGRLLHQGRYVDGEPDGIHYRFAENGRLIARESYRRGIPHGDWLETNYSGAIVHKTSYDNGQVKTEVILETTDANWLVP